MGSGFLVGQMGDQLPGSTACIRIGARELQCESRPARRVKVWNVAWDANVHIMPAPK